VGIARRLQSVCIFKIQIATHFAGREHIVREHRTSNRSAFTAGFTLVELLVVIGIIAILVGILIPVLAGARQSAQAAKCAAALREIGDVFKLYSMDTKKGYYPPCFCTVSPSPYKVFFKTNPPMTFDPSTASGSGTYWMYFLAPYVSHAKFGGATGTTAQDVSNSMNTILWGCPNFVPVQNNVGGEGNVAGIATVYTGYGMNAFPEYTAQHPAQNALLGDSGTGTGPNADPLARSCLLSSNDNWTNYTGGRWYTYKAYTSSADRALIGDCRAYVLEASGATGPNSFIGQVNIQAIGTTGQFWANGQISEGESSYDYYRHGKYPGMMNSLQYNVNGGKIGYNVLFADGHVSKLITREEGFKAARMRFPG